MPYIKREERAPINDALQPLITWINDYGLTPGQLNYIITRLCLRTATKAGLNYTAFNGVIGVLECAKLELYRRVIADYEDEKAYQNGDVE